MGTILKALSSAAVMLALTTVSLAAQRGTPDPERAATRQILLELGNLLQTGNWAKADSAFAARGVHVLADTMAYHSWAEYRDKMLKPELEKLSGLKVANTNVESVVRGDVAWIAFRQEIGASSGMAKVARGTAVLEKREGRWVIVHFHVSR